MPHHSWRLHGSADCIPQRILASLRWVPLTSGWHLVCCKGKFQKDYFTAVFALLNNGFIHKK